MSFQSITNSFSSTRHVIFCNMSMKFYPTPLVYCFQRMNVKYVFQISTQETNKV